MKTLSVLYASAFLLLASCEGDSDSSETPDQKTNSPEQVGTEKENGIKLLMSDYTTAANDLFAAIDAETSNRAKVHSLFNAHFETEDKSSKEEILEQIKTHETNGEELKEIVLGLIDPVMRLSVRIEAVYFDLTTEQQKLFEGTKSKMGEELDL